MRRMRAREKRLRRETRERTGPGEMKKGEREERVRVREERESPWRPPRRGTRPPWTALPWRGKHAPSPY
jgi:hypothetical protein